MQIQFIKSSDFGRIKKNDQKTTFCAYLILLGHVFFPSHRRTFFRQFDENVLGFTLPLL